MHVTLNKIKYGRNKDPTLNPWSYLTTELVSSTECGCDRVTPHTPPPPLTLFLLFTLGGGIEECAQRGRGRLCSCLGGRGVSGGGEGGSLFEDSAFASPAWLFEAVRWPHRATSLQVGGSMEAALWGMEACHLYTAVSFILSSSPFPSPPTSLSLPLPSPLLFLWRCCFTPSPRPLQALKEKLYSAARLPVLRPCNKGMMWATTIANIKIK